MRSHYLKLPKEVLLKPILMMEQLVRRGRFGELIFMGYLIIIVLGNLL
jgi:hypothetical protein